MATGYGVCIHIIPEHLAISSMGTRGQAGPKPYAQKEMISQTDYY